MWAKAGLRALRSQPRPHNQRKRQNQRPGSEIKGRARLSAHGRKALIGRLVICNGRGTVTTGVFARIAEAAEAAARAPFSADRMAGKCDGRERDRTDLLIISGRRKREWESEYANRC